MLPVLTIVGRPNVGKSTLFNYLTQTRDALVFDTPGVTRDRQYGESKLGGQRSIIVDTGGITGSKEEGLDHLMSQQVSQAMSEADRLLYMVDAQVGVTDQDLAIAKLLRPYQDQVVLLVNKADREVAGVVEADFYQLGLGQPIAIAAESGRGISAMMDDLLLAFPPEPSIEKSEDDDTVRLAVLGRPNAGKSTLVNRLLGEDRVIVSDKPGTTRDSIAIPFERHDKKYILVDTAGVRRRSKVSETVEKFSVVKALQAMSQADVVMMIVNAEDGVTDQDMRLLGLVLTHGRSLVLLFNKWDCLSEKGRESFKEEVERKLPFVNFARRYYISALEGSGVGLLYRAVHEAEEALSKPLSTGELTRVMQAAVVQHAPPMVHGKRVRFRFAHVGGRAPLLIIIHGRRVKGLPSAYTRYLAGYFRKHFALMGVLIHIRFKHDEKVKK